MANYFDESYYLKAKLAQLKGSTDANGNAWTEASLKSAISDLGMTPEMHYEAFGRGERLNPNPYFNESEYLSAKLKQLESVGDKGPNGNGWTLNSLAKAISDLGLTPAQHYEMVGAYETNANGTLINPSNAFDANAYFSAKLAQMQAKGESLGDKPASALTVAEVVAAVKAAGISPVTHYEAFGAQEAGAQGVPLVQTVPVTQRVTNDTAGRAITGENVPGNYNPASAGPAAAVAAPVTKPADIGAKAPASVSPPVVAPGSSLPVPGDTNYVIPPAGLTDTNAKPVIPPSTTVGTGPNAGFIVVDTATGKGTVIKPDGTTQGTVDVPVSGGVITPPKPDAPVIDGSGNNTNDKPADNGGKPIVPSPDPDPTPTPTPPPAATFKTVAIDADDTDPQAALFTDADAAAHTKGLLLSGGSANAEVLVARVATVPAADAALAAKSPHGMTMTATSGFKAGEVMVALADGAANGAAQTVKVDLQGVTIGKAAAAVADADYAAQAVKGFHVVDKTGAEFADWAEDVKTYRHNVDVTVTGDNSVQLSSLNLPPDLFKVSGTGNLTLNNVLAQGLKGGTPAATDGIIAYNATGLSGKLTMEVVANDGTGGNSINLANVSLAANKTLNLNLVDKLTTGTDLTVGLKGGMATDIRLDDGWTQSLVLTGSATADTVTLGMAAGAADAVNFKLAANLGAGNDTIILDAGTALPANFVFAADSAINGGDGTDTLKLTGAGWNHRLLNLRTDTSLDKIEKIDLSGVTGVTIDLTGQKEKFDINYGTGNTVLGEYKDVTATSATAQKVYVTDAEVSGAEAHAKGLRLSGGGVDAELLIARVASTPQSTLSGAKKLNDTDITVLNGFKAKDVAIALATGASTAADQTLSIDLQGVTIGKTAASMADYGTESAKGFHVVNNAGTNFTDWANDISTYKYNVDLNITGENSVQFAQSNLPPAEFTIAGTGNLTLNNVVAQAVKGGEGAGVITYNAEALTGKLTMEVVGNDTQVSSAYTGHSIDLANITLAETKALYLNLVDQMTTDSHEFAVKLNPAFNTDIRLAKGWNNDLKLAGSSMADTVTLGLASDIGDTVSFKLAVDLGGGNDTFILDAGAALPANFTFEAGSTLNGGAGDDTLKLTGAGWNGHLLNLQGVGTLESIEHIDLTGISGMTINITGAAGSIDIIGAAGNTVNWLPVAP